MAERDIYMRKNNSEANRHSDALFDCAHSIEPAINGADGKISGPWQIDTIYKHGMSGDHWLAERTIDRSGKTGEMIRYRANGTTYVDNISLSGQEELLVMDPYGAHEVDKGSKEEKSILAAIHELNFEKCSTGQR